MDPTMNALANNLRHVYFFLGSTHAASPGLVAHTNHATTTETKADRSASDDDRSPSPTLSSSSTTTKGSSSGLNASAPIFTPSPTKTMFDPANAPEFVPSPTKSAFGAIADNFFEIRDVPGKGLGVVATRDILPGTRVLCEAPLLRNHSSDISGAWLHYQSLDQVHKEAYDSLSSVDVAGIEHLARACLLGGGSQGMEEDDFEKLVKDCARVLSIFKCNAYSIEHGGTAVYTIASRFNHSCRPNIHHTFNAELQAETLHATQLIKSGEELTTNYMAQQCYFQTHTQRWEWLRQHYGFTCQCQACIDRTAMDDVKRELLYAIIWGLQEFEKGASKADVADSSKQYVPDSLIAAFAQAKDVIQVLTDLHVFGPELSMAYRQASEIAFALQDLDNAMQYALFEAQHERDIFGDDAGKLYPGSKSSSAWIQQIRAASLSITQAPLSPASPKKKKSKKNLAWKKRKEQQQQQRNEGSKDRGSGKGNGLAPDAHAGASS